MGYFIAMMVGICYSVSHIFIRKGMERSRSDNGVLMTAFINFVLLGGVWAIYRIFHKVQLTWTGVALFVIAGLLTTFLGRAALFMSFRSIGPSRGAAIKNSNPIFTVLFAVVLLGETLSFAPSVGILFVFAGLAIQGYSMFRQTKDGDRSRRGEKFGYGIALVSAVSFGIGQGFRKLGLEQIADPFFGAFVSTVVALSMSLLLEMRRGPLGKQVAEHFKKLNIYYVGAGIMTGIAMLSFFVATTYIQVSYVAVVAALEPLLTIILSKMFLKNEDKIAMSTVAAACMVFTGVVVLILFGG